MGEIAAKKITASTLIEVLIAMVIIMVMFSIALMLFNNVMSSSVSFKKTEAHNNLQVLAKKVTENGYLQDDALLLDSINYKFSVDSAFTGNITKLEIRASFQGKPLGSVKRLFRIKQKPNEKN